MNTDITASAKPEYPVIDRNPPFTKTVANFNTLDYLRLTTISGISVTVGYLSGIKPGIRGPSMVTGGLIGVMGGFIESQKFRRVEVLCNVEMITECLGIIHLLPPMETALPDWVINLMAYVVQYEQFSNMVTHNIAMVFAPK
nr:NADH-ubiquinone oxidoreductase 20.9 kDa subunit [Tanacetum cinerariifolium]